MPKPSTVAPLIAAVIVAAGAAQQPVFRAGVNLLRLDVRVVAGDGTPVTDLTDADFDVQVNGTSCPVQTSRFLDFTASESASARRTYRDLSTNIAPVPRRLTVIAVDEDSLPQDSRPLMESLAGYVEQLGPNDRTALIALPPPGIWHDFTNDAAALRTLFLRLSSRKSLDNGRTLAGVGSGDGGQTLSGGSVFTDRGEVADPRQRQRTSLATNEWNTGVGESQLPALHAADLVHALQGLTRVLGEIEGPKTLLLVSSKIPAGVGLDDYKTFARAAAEARLTVYVLKPHMFVASATGNVTQIADALAPAAGLDTLAGTTGGVVLNAVARAPEVMDRIGRETSGTYILGVAPPAGVPADTPLDVVVHVRRPDLTIRSPKIVIGAPASSRKGKADDPKARIARLLQQPRVATEVPLRVTSLSMAGSQSGTLKTEIVAEIDEPSRDAGLVSWGFEIRDGDRLVTATFGQSTSTDPDAARRVLLGGAALAPGTYALRLATVDAAGRRASVEHPLEVGLFPAGDLHVSDLFVGEVVGGHFQPRITVDTEQLAAFIEVYQTRAAPGGPLSVEFTLRGPDGASRAATRAAVRVVPGQPKAEAQAVLPLAHVGAGLYDVVATVLQAGRPIVSVRRQVIVAGR